MSFLQRALWRRQASLFTNLSRTTPRQTLRFRPGRFQSTVPPPPPPPNSAKANTLFSRLASSRFIPTRLKSALAQLRSAPVSHIVAFLILHEITAILPIFGLTYFFYKMDWVPTSWVLGPWAAWAEDGVKKYVPYFRKKSWYGLEKGEKDGEDVLEGELREEVAREQKKEKKEGRSWLRRAVRKEDVNEDTAVKGVEQGEKSKKGVEQGEKSKKAVVWQTVKQAVTVDHTEKGYKIGIQIAAAYTITKFLLVPRVALSLWMTPWMARRFIRLRHTMWRKKPSSG
ncbi:hypothetical protein F5Y18DRAFT_360512 [Xylariaceae sp. FL1019]|nr:hypothetical protein F5Y18DRAFT_360512 [Xylariaceae sp. FL1019]